MASDYKWIAQENARRYGEETEHLRIYKRLYSDKTHFVSELIQNADDSKSRYLELQLDSNALFVSNDGRQFTEEDVINICSLGLSNKDLTQIGTFGIGFKAVYNYTDSPEIYSGAERFLIRDLIKPESIGVDGVTPRIATQLNEGRTVFQLPFKDSIRPEDIERLKKRCRDLDKRSLLFLRHLEMIHWHEASTQQGGFYSCQRSPHDKIQGASYVKLQTSVDGDNQSAETFLVFRKEVQPPQYVIDELLYQAEDRREELRIQRSMENLQPIEVAFKLDAGRITTMDNCVLFAYLPTEIKTDLQFIIQARYQTTPARDNIPKPSENPWNKWLVQETANFLPEILEQLKAAELLEPAFFNLIPLKDDPVPETFTPISEALQQAMRERTFVPTEDGGYAKADSVFYPHRESLRALIESSWLCPNSSWLHSDIRDTEEFRQCFKVMREAGVQEIGISQVLDWLERQDYRWFERRGEKWLRSLYIYLSIQKSELKRIRKLPLVRLENGKHVCASSESVFFPPNETEMREEIALYFKELPILRSSLLTEDTRSDTETFLKKLRVRTLHHEDLIREICSKYQSDDLYIRIDTEQNRSHVRYLRHFLSKASEAALENLMEEISKTPILLVYKEDQREDLYYGAPCEAYLPQAYTGSADLETYFSGCSDVWYVDDGYLDDNADPKNWLQFLKWIGANDTPRILKEDVPVNATELRKRDLKEQYSTARNLTIEDVNLEGLLETLAKITNPGERSLSLALWHLLIKVLPSEEWQRDAFFQGICRWFHYKERSEPFDAAFYRQLKSTAWLLDEQGTLRFPSECFAPTSENRKVLGDSVVYLHPDFDVSRDNETAQWLAEKLGIHLNADTENVLNYLQTLSGTETNVEKVKPLYRFLDRQNARRSEEFMQKPLILTSNPEPRWWKSDEVFWEDQSEVFGSHRGYLKGHYSETLKLFFTSLGVSEQASQLDYAQCIQEVTATEQAADENVRERIQKLYRGLQPWELMIFYVEEWDMIYNSRCWLGKRGEEYSFFTRQELISNDHPHIGKIFEGKVPFWAFDDDSHLSNLVGRLEIERCSHAQAEYRPEGYQEEDTDWSEKVRKLHPYIYAFLNSPPFYDPNVSSPSSEELDSLSVYRVKELKVTYTLKGVSVPDQDPRPSFLSLTEQHAKLWLGLEVSKDEYAELISDAFQEHFGGDQLGRFVEDLLTKERGRVLSNWKRKGLELGLPDEDKPIEVIDVNLPSDLNSEDTDPAANESDMKIPTDNEISKADGEDDESLEDKATESKRPTNSASDIRGISLPDTQTSTKTEDVTFQSTNRKSEHEASVINERPEMRSGDASSTIKESETGRYTPSRIGGTSRSGGHSLSTSSRKSGSGGHGSSGGGGEGAEHRELKERVAANPFLLSVGLELIGLEYTFKSNDRVDILLRDSSENPVTVEIETNFSHGEGRFVGIWQAVKYKHLAAVEYGLPCEQVRSILAAPEIPDDVKKECEKLGIEPIEVSD